MRHAMIMAGGAGTRLWPLSRRQRPKQLLPLIPNPSPPSRPGHPGTPPGREPQSLLQLAAARLDGLVPPEQRCICTGEAYRDIIRRALPEFTDEQILGEPVGRDTVNAVGLTAAVLAGRDPQAVFAVLTADHVIEPHETFRQRMELGFRLVDRDPSRLVTFSITPTHPATGYGYVERGEPITDIRGHDGHCFRVRRFVEKPDLPTARQYLDAGTFGWNSGMFIFHARTVLDALARFAPDNHAGLVRIAEAWDTPRRTKVLEEVYPTLPRTSVDYALMEPASADDTISVATVQMDVRWLDVGSWPSYAQTLEPDTDGNRTAGPGTLIQTDARNNLVVTDTPGHTVAILGCEDLIVVQTADATLIMPADRAEQLKTLYDQLPETLR